jgi:dual-specificity kinase
MVFELLSLSIFDFLKANKFTPFNISQIRALSRQLIQSVAFIHDELNLIHTDLKPENIMFVSEEYRKASHVVSLASNRHIQFSHDIKRKQKGLLSSSNSELSTAAVLDTRIKLIDFGSAIFEKDHHSSVVCTRHYRAPEIILGIPWSYPCDIWSIGCILIEFFTGIAVFQTHEK